MRLLNGSTILRGADLDGPRCDRLQGPVMTGNKSSPTGDRFELAIV